MYRTILVALCIAGNAIAAPIRESPRNPEVEEKPSVPLEKLAKDQTASFGDWTVGHAHEENGLILIHRPSKLAVYLPWSSNGWVNYRTGDGTSRVLYSRGDSQPQGREYHLDKLLAKPAPMNLAAGVHTLQMWTVTVTAETMEFHCKAMNCRMTIRRSEAKFTHNSRTIGGP